MTEPTTARETLRAPVAGAAASAPGIDPRAPRFGAAITAALLLAVVVLSLVGADVAALALLTAIAAIFAWGASAGIRHHPYGAIFRLLVRPRLSRPAELEDPRPPTFAQLIGLVVTGVGVLLGLVGLAPAVPVAASLAFIAAFLNAAFDFCLGCELYLGAQRLRIRRAARA
ncbi:DUF4395 domain-containing protein [Glaciibacter flavus]|uniref:DUF4395 domain-containing protein n=1 Tax=Orlajensenia flava TaxID=2565934 RepID=UPI003B0078AE